MLLQVRKSSSTVLTFTAIVAVVAGVVVVREHRAQIVEEVAMGAQEQSQAEAEYQSEEAQLALLRQGHIRPSLPLPLLLQHCSRSPPTRLQLRPHGMSGCDHATAAAAPPHFASRGRLLFWASSSSMVTNHLQCLTKGTSTDLNWTDTDGRTDGRRLDWRGSNE